MTDAVLVGLIAAVPGTIAAIATFWGNRKVNAVALSINGRLTELLESRGKEQHAEGRAEGVESERNR